MEDSSDDVMPAGAELSAAFKLIQRDQAEAPEESSQDGLSEAAEEPTVDTPEEGDEEVGLDDTKAPTDDEKPKDERLSDSWAKVMKMHAKLQEQAKQLKERERQLQEQPRPSKELDELVRLAKTDPVAFLESQGVSYNDAYEKWTRRLLGTDDKDEKAQKQTTVDPEEIERRVSERIAEQMRRHETQLEARRWLSDAESILNNDKYKAIRVLGAEGELEQLAAMYLTQNGKLLSPQEAADMILPEAKKRLTELSQFASSLQPESRAEEEKLPPTQRKGTKTLKADLGNSSQPVVDEDDEPSDVYSELRRAAKFIA